MPLIEALRLAGAPAALIAWVAESADEYEAWDGCGRGDWLLWMGACAPLPIETLIQAAAATVAAAISQLEGAGLHRLERALAVLSAGGERPESEALAPSCDLSGAEAPLSYRTALARGHAHATAAVAWLARAAEASRAARAMIEGARDQEALGRAASVGVPPALMTPPASAPTLDPQAVASDPAQQELSYVVAAAAQAVLEAGLALAPAGPASAARQAAEELSDGLHERLAAVWDDALRRAHR